jgi:tetratricopeptide (TPR) repeat protein
MVRAPSTLAACLIGAAAVYSGAFWTMTTLDARSAWSRFEALTASGATGRAVGHGNRALSLMIEDGLEGETLQARQFLVAKAHAAKGNPDTAIELFRIVLDSPYGSRLTEADRMAIKNTIAQLSLATGRPVDAAVIIAEFVDAAGDGAAQNDAIDPDSIEAVYIAYANSAVGPFTDALPPMTEHSVIMGSEDARLYAAERLTTLGGYYARLDDGAYAAAGLLSAAYRTRMDLLGADHEDTVHTALLLGPVFERIGRISDAEDVYLAAFHAQERAKGPNNPELSLYIRVLSDVYRRQGRITEAEALNEHMRNIFRDAFGARRYAANRERDRVADVNRPVSPEFPLPADYAPTDLVKASLFSIPTSKNPDLDEMKIRAAQLDTDITMPKMLADLIGECRTEQENLTLRSGYRSYATQVYLYNETDHGGKVAVPGTSEHQTGLAVDIDVNGRFMRSTDRAYQCFEEQAWRYGFILSFPQDNAYLDAQDPYEPWHWRFVGPRTALLYRETGPRGRPQEFLAALPCYEERALSGLFITAGQEDVCLATVRQRTAGPAAPTAGAG